MYTHVSVSQLSLRNSLISGQTYSSLTKSHLVYVHTKAESVCTSTKTIPDRASVHT